MKVILLKDIPNIGKKHEVKEVASGYALNFLIPHKLAETATASALQKLEIMKKQTAEKEAVEHTLLLKSLADLSGKTLELKEKVNEKGHLFAQVNPVKIATLLAEKCNFSINPENIISSRPIKEVGEFEIEIKIQNKSIKVNLSVKAA